MIVKNQDEKAYWQLIKEIGAHNDRWDESVSTKSDIIDKLIKSLDPVAKNILFTSFNPIAIDLAKSYNVSIISNSELTTVFDFSKIELVDMNSAKQYDIVLSLDEYFTYAGTEDQQRDLLDQVRSKTNGWLITTLQDYKNFAPHKKNHIDAFGINGEHNYTVLENSIADRIDKQVWNHYFYCIKDHDDLLTIGPIKRRTMYFKQLAKYSSDAGSKQYVIQKNLLYKGFFSKNFEHIITVKF